MVGNAHADGSAPGWSPQIPVFVLTMRRGTALADEGPESFAPTVAWSADHQMKLP